MRSLRRLLGFLIACLGLLHTMLAFSFGNLVAFGRAEWAWIFLPPALFGLLLIAADKTCWRAARLFLIRRTLDAETLRLAAIFYFLARRITLGITAILFAVGFVLLVHDRLQAKAINVPVFGYVFAMCIEDVLWGLILSEMIFLPLACAARQDADYNLQAIQPRSE